MRRKEMEDDMDGYKSYKKILLKKIGKIDSISQLQKGLQFIIHQEKSASYENSNKAALKALWWDCHKNNKNNWCDLEWEIKKYPTIKKNKYTKIPLTTLDIQNLINNCHSIRQKLFIEFLAETGLRVSEMTDILTSDCCTNGENIEISIVAKKTDRQLYKKITHALFNEIKKTCNGREYLFQTGGGKAYRPEYISMQIKQVGKRINKDISAHSLRHFYITSRINNGDNPTIISRSVGHINPGSILNSYYTGI